MQAGAKYRCTLEGSLQRRDQQGRYRTLAGQTLQQGERAAEQESFRNSPDCDRLRRVIGAAADWAALHAALRGEAASYQKSGSGAAIILDDGERLKASALGRECSRPVLEKKLGPYEPAPDGTVDPGYVRYQQAHAIVVKQLNEERRAVRVHLAMERGRGREPGAGERALKHAIEAAVKEIRHQRLSEQQWRARGRPAAPIVEAVGILLKVEGAPSVRQSASQPALSSPIEHAIGAG